MLTKNTLFEQDIETLSHEINRVEKEIVTLAKAQRERTLTEVERKRAT